MKRMKIACLLGAGFSSRGGLPLVNGLFDVDLRLVANWQVRHFSRVIEHYTRWKQANPTRNVENYLEFLYQNASLASSAPPFVYAAQLIAAVLSQPVSERDTRVNPRYGNRITTPSHVTEHEAFFRTIFKYSDMVSVLTTNYDLLIERCLRHKPMKRVFGVGFMYGGLGRPQVLKGTAQPFRETQDRQRTIELAGNTSLFKLHGSLNWAADNLGNLRLFQDPRSAFNKTYQVAIIPPVQNKAMPVWLGSIWQEAEIALSQADVWVICGYSLPDYDVNIAKLLRCGAEKVSHIFLLDPNGEELSSKFQAIAPFAQVVSLSGLPSGLDELEPRLGKIA
ncbi:MAG: SIR2 family protein [Chloroflexi bacterium]|nr:SIR2 family protein [Chloroflexota bacterium]